jgi:predicted ArsR family transcriptional regulator
MNAAGSSACRSIHISARHAIATLVLALEPGNYGKAAAVLGITAATVRRHYGHEEGKRAAAEVRKALLAEYPDIVRLMKGKMK